MSEIEILQKKLEASEKWVQRLLAENQRLSRKIDKLDEIDAVWVSEFDQRILELQERLAIKEELLTDALDKVAGFMEATAPQQIKIENNR